MTATGIRSLTLYIAGPMSSIESYNYPEFYAAAGRLRGAGYGVVSPAECHAERPGEVPWCEYVRRDLTAMLSYTDGVALLPGYERSPGAMLEIYVATVLGMECKLIDRWLEPQTPFGGEDV